MSFSINTNTASLDAQNYLRVSSDFQNQTINRVTSGLRIVSSGDDAAGLAIANSYRSNEAVLTQGIRNANDGLSQLQIADGGLNNISQLLDRARTLATQSASGTFTGDRGVLNSEFQSVLSEVDRQAQAIGLNVGGTFAKSLAVFIGGGAGSTSAAQIANGSVSVDLSTSTVDSLSLGLKGVQASGKTGTDIGTGSATSSVATILANATNTASEANAGFTDFYFTGPGFSDTSGNNVVKVSVNLSGVSDTASLVNAINSAIQGTATGGSQQATAFKNSNVVASIVTDAQGRSQLAFKSSSAAFSVQGGDKVANAFLGNISTGSTGVDGAVTATGASALTNAATAGSVKIRILGAGLDGNSSNDISLTLGAGDTRTTIVSNINAAIAANATLAATGIQASVDGSNNLVFSGHAGQTFEVLTAGDVTDQLGFGAYAGASGVAGGGVFDYNSLQAAGAAAAKTQGIAVSVGGGATVDLGVLTSSATEATALTTLNNAFQGNATLRAIGLVATDNGGKIKISSTTNADFRLQFYAGTGDGFGFGDTSAGFAGPATDASIGSVYAGKTSVDSQGANFSANSTGTDAYKFTGLRTFGDTQTVTVTAVDPTGTQHTLNVNLSTSNASNLDQALSTINTALQQSNDTVLKQIAAVKELGTSGAVNNTEGIRFLSSGTAFKVSLGSTQVGDGISDGQTGSQGGQPLASAIVGDGGTADISNQSTAQAAVTAMATAVTTLGKAQAVVGRGENQFTYAVNLAESQVTNLASAESRIRDADLASEAANLTKAQILLQAGVAALAQANSAPQAILSLLRG